jgi:hypothetical protein
VDWLLFHAAPISYKFPLPIWLYAVAGGVAVLASAPAAALAASGRGRAIRRTRNLYPWIRPLRIGPVVSILLALVLVWSLAGGIGARTAEGHEFFENPITVIVWVDLWVGLGIVAALVGDVWDLVSPLNWAARFLDRALARRDLAPFRYPERLGRWPALGLLLLWSWAELVWAPAKEPHVLAAIGLGYIAATLIGTLFFGVEAWLDNVELFTVFSRTLSRFAPLDLTPSSPELWLASPREERELRLRMYGAGVGPEPPLQAGGGAFVLATLATVVFDGFSQTRRYAGWRNSIESHAGALGRHIDVFDTLVLLVVVGLFCLAFVLVAGLVCGGDWRRGTRLYAPTLIPIAAVYFIAHYFVYLVFVGQLTLGVLVDPFGHGWNPWGLGEYAIWKDIPAAATWWVQVALIVWGHVVAVFAAHRIAAAEAGPRRALVTQTPLVLLMVGYTVAGLWVLAQQIAAGA